MVPDTITLEGHLIDSDIMRRVFDRVVEEGGEFEVQEFRVGRTNDEPSFARVEVRTATRSARPDPRGVALPRGDHRGGDCVFAPAEADGILPDDFYSTTNFDTLVRIDGRWVEAVDQKMERRSCCAAAHRYCVKQGLVRQGEPVALRGPGSGCGPSSEPRLRGVRLHVERRLGRDQQGDRDPGRGARDEARARGGRAYRRRAGAGRRPLRAVTRRSRASCATAGWT